MGEIAITPILSYPLFAFFIVSNNLDNLEESTIVTEYPNSTTCAPVSALTFCFSLQTLLNHKELLQNLYFLLIELLNLLY